jgi:hypothetical protein
MNVPYFTSEQKLCIMDIMRRYNSDKYSTLTALKTYLSTFHKDFKEYGLDYANVAYAIWYTYGNN